MNTKHTPGPWIISNHIDEEGFADIEAENDLLYIRASWGGPVRHADRPRLDRIMVANARLIAAAPDLLEALQLAGFSAGYQYMTDETRAVIGAAIAKATGAA